MLPEHHTRDRRITPGAGNRGVIAWHRACSASKMLMGSRSPLACAAGLSIAALMLLGFSGLREDEIECEHAMAHLAACCPEFAVEEGVCNYNDGCGTTRLTVLTVDTSECIQERSCDEIEELDLCARVAQLAQPVIRDTASSGAATQALVCP
jgi:hypothetical protein